MTWTLKVDAAQLDESAWKAGFYVKPVANVDGELVPVMITDSSTGKTFNPNQNPFPLTDGVLDLELPSQDYPTVQPEFFGFIVQIGPRQIVVPAQADGAEKTLESFVDPVQSLQMVPADQVRLTEVEAGLAAELVARAAGDATLTTAVAAEATARAAAVTAEATTRGNADTALSTAIGLKADASALATETSARIAGDALNLAKASNFSDLASASTARTNLGVASVTEMPPTPERFGAAGNGVTDDTAALAAWAAGGFSGISLRPGSAYMTTAAIAPTSATKQVIGNGATIKAAAAIAGAMWRTPGTGTRLEYAVIQDIVFDCNQLAQQALNLRWGGRVDLTNLTAIEPTADGFQIGDSTAAATSFGINAYNLRSVREISATLAAGSRGLFVDAADDCMFVGGQFVNFETGLRNNGGSNKFYSPHAFGRDAARLPVICMDDNGVDNEWYGANIDSPSSIGLRIRKQGRTRVVGGRVYSNAFVTDNTIVGIQVDTALSDLTMTGVAFVAVDASHRIATDIVGDLTLANITGTIWSAGTHVVTQNAVARLRNVMTATINGATTLARPIVEVRSSTTLASNGAVTINSATAQYQQVFLQANATSSAISNATSGGRLTIEWSQDATGGRTYAWPTDCRFAGNSAPSDTTASRSTAVTFVRGAGNLWREISRSVAVPIS